MSLKKPTDSEAEAGIDVLKASDADDLFEKIEIADTEKPKPKRKLGFMLDENKPQQLLDYEAAEKLDAELDREVLKLFYPEDYEDEDTAS